MASIKASVTIKNENRINLKDNRNKSKVINEALELYFHKKDYMQKAEENRLKQIVGVVDQDYTEDYKDHLVSKYS